MNKNPREEKNRKQKAPKRAKHYALKEIKKSQQEETAQVFADLEQDEADSEKTAEDKTTRNRLNRRAPDRYGLPLYICGVEKQTKERK